VASVSDDLAPPPWTPAQAAPPPSLLDADVEHVAISDRPDPLSNGFLLAGGVLAILPTRVRLPHEDDEDDDAAGPDDAGPDGGQDTEPTRV
jgi:hypothetical protein